MEVIYRNPPWLPGSPSYPDFLFFKNFSIFPDIAYPNSVLKKINYQKILEI